MFSTSGISFNSLRKPRLDSGSYQRSTHRLRI